MYLLYLDDAGSADNPAEDYLVLGGIAVHELQLHWVTSQLDNLAASIPNVTDPHTIEFHASEIFSARQAPWRGMNRDESRGVIRAVLSVMRNCREPARAFACAVHKASFVGRDPMRLAFEDLCSRFDRFLARLHAAGDRQKGLLILDESAHETSLQEMARGFRTLGTQWGAVRNLAEVPLFVDSRVSRPVQLADHIAYAVFRRFNAGDAHYFDIISSKFDMSDGVVHGLSHMQNVDQNCMCPGCLSRRLARDNRPIEPD